MPGGGGGVRKVCVLLGPGGMGGVLLWGGGGGGGFHEVPEIFFRGPCPLPHHLGFQGQTGVDTGGFLGRRRQRWRRRRLGKFFSLKGVKNGRRQGREMRERGRTRGKF